MSFFRSLFGSKNSHEKIRKLSHPRDLRVGDIIKFGFMELSDVSTKEFEVSQINTYIYGDLCYPELILKDRRGDIIFMMVEEEDGDEYLALSKKVDKAKINEIISPNDMTAIQQKGNGTSISITSKPDDFTQWLVNSYQEVDDNIKGSFVKGDARYLSDEELRRQEKFSAYILEDQDGEYALEVEVYSTGETELSVTTYQDIEEIKEMWPGNIEK